MPVNAQAFFERKRLESQEGGRMNKKDYERIAAVIRESFAFHTQAQRAAFTLDMEASLRGTNENWDSRLWHEACRPEGNYDDMTAPELPKGVLKAYPFTPPAIRRVT